jgi:hypothetical protein
MKLLLSHGARSDKWLVDGYGISAADTGHQKQASAGNSGHKCWYVLDVLLYD